MKSDGKRQKDSRGSNSSSIYLYTLIPWCSTSCMLLLSYMRMLKASGIAINNGRSSRETPVYQWNSKFQLYVMRSMLPSSFILLHKYHFALCVNNCIFFSYTYSLSKVLIFIYCPVSYEHVWGFNGLVSGPI